MALTMEEKDAATQALATALETSISYRTMVEQAMTTIRERDATIAHLLDALEQAMEWNWLDTDVPHEVVAQCEAALLLRETLGKGE